MLNADRRTWAGYAPVAVFAILTPLVSLPWRDGSTLVFYLAAAFSLLAVVLHAARGRALAPSHGLQPMAYALIAPMVAVLGTSLHLGTLHGSEFEKALRFALTLPILWLMNRTPRHWLRHVQWGLLGGALIGSAMLMGILLWLGLDRNAVGEYGARYNAVTFANLTLLFGMACLLTLPWTLSPWARAERLAKIATGLLAVLATLLSETRSSWMVMPVVLLILLCEHWRARTGPQRRVFLSLGACGFLLLSTASVVAIANPRVAIIATEVQQFMHGTVMDTSIGIRLQLWQASLTIFEQHPWLGIGASNFRNALALLSTQGVVSPWVAANFGEPHNDLMAALAGYGIVGVAALLAVYLVPATFFFKRLGSSDPTVRVAARLGLLVCLGYLAFGMTETMFRNMRGVPIYSCLVAMFISLTRTTPGPASSLAQPPALQPDARLSRQS